MEQKQLEKGQHVLWKWNQEVYVIQKVLETDVVIKNIKDGSIAKEPKEDMIYIYNM